MLSIYYNTVPTGKPTINPEGRKKLSFEEGETASLVCSSSGGNPPATIDWNFEWDSTVIDHLHKPAINGTLPNDPELTVIEKVPFNSTRSRIGWIARIAHDGAIVTCVASRWSEFDRKFDVAVSSVVIHVEGLRYKEISCTILSITS